MCDIWLKNYNSSKEKFAGYFVFSIHVKIADLKLFLHYKTIAFKLFKS